MELLRRFRQYVHPPTKQERQEIIADITESASLGFGFFTRAPFMQHRYDGAVHNFTGVDHWAENDIYHGPWQAGGVGLSALLRALSG